MSENTVESVNNETPKKRGRKPSPFTAATRKWEQAKNKADKARAAYEKVQRIADALAEAETAEQEAYSELQAVFAENAPVSE